MNKENTHINDFLNIASLAKKKPFKKILGKQGGISLFDIIHFYKERIYMSS